MPGWRSGWLSTQIQTGDDNSRLASIRSRMRRSVVSAVKIRCVGNKAENIYEVATGVEVEVEVEVKTAAEQDGRPSCFPCS